MHNRRRNNRGISWALTFKVAMVGLAVFFGIEIYDRTTNSNVNQTPLCPMDNGLEYLYQTNASPHINYRVHVSQYAIESADSFFMNMISGWTQKELKHTSEKIIPAACKVTRVTEAKNSYSQIHQSLGIHNLFNNCDMLSIESDREMKRDAQLQCIQWQMGLALQRVTESLKPQSFNDRIYTTAFYVAMLSILSSWVWYIIKSLYEVARRDYEDLPQRNLDPDERSQAINELINLLRNNPNVNVRETQPVNFTIMFAQNPEPTAEEHAAQINEQLPAINNERILELEAKYETEIKIPNDYICDITKLIMDDPVRAQYEDKSYTKANYEYNALQEWATAHSVNGNMFIDPIRQNCIAIVKNPELKNQITQFIEDEKTKLENASTLRLR